jgi:hypothetical protein
MNVEQNSSTVQHNVAPWVFSAAVTFEPKTVDDKDILSCTIYKSIAEQLAQQLFNTEKMLRDSLRGGLSVQFEELKLEHFDLGGRFDRVICTLTLTNRGPARFLLETRFFLSQSLVTTATQESILYFDELN